MTLSIRTRLTLWYTGALSLVLLAFATAAYLAHSRSRMASVDEELARTAALVVGLVTAELEDGADLSEAAVGALEDVEMPGRSVALFDPAGVRLSGRWDGLPLPAPGVGDGSHATVRTGGGSFRIHRTRRTQQGTAFQVGVAEPLTAVEQELLGLRRALLGSAIFGLALAAAGGWGIARAALGPVALMAGEARRITDRTPGLRLTSGSRADELGVLAGSFNDLLARLESALAQQRQFMADASHELRTPVSAARTAIEVTLGQPRRSEEEYRDSLGIVADQMRRLTRLVEDMFTLARADVAGLPLDRGPLYLDELVADCVKEARLLAAPKGVAVDSDGASEIEASGDERRLRQLLMNLLGNAIRHTPPGGSVRVDVALRDGAVEVAVTDTGGGIPEAERERVFERFVRLDAARSGEGAGLGLPIARAIAEAHGGALVLARSDASGSLFLARLPLSAPGA